MFGCSFREACKTPVTECIGVYENRASSSSYYDSDASGLAVPDQSEKEKNLLLMWSSLPIRARISECAQITGYGDDGADAGGGNSDAHCTCRLGERNNMNTDSQHTDSSGRTGVQGTRRDNN